MILLYFRITNPPSGFFGRNEMQKEFEEAAFALQPGQVSGIVDTASGVHLIERYGSRVYISIELTTYTGSSENLELAL